MIRRPSILCLIYSQTNTNVSLLTVSADLFKIYVGVLKAKSSTLRIVASERIKVWLHRPDDDANDEDESSPLWHS